MLSELWNWNTIQPTSNCHLEDCFYQEKKCIPGSRFIYFFIQEILVNAH